MYKVCNIIQFYIFYTNVMRFIEFKIQNYWGLDTSMRKLLNGQWIFEGFRPDHPLATCRDVDGP